MTREDHRLAYPKHGAKSFASGIPRVPCFSPAVQLPKRQITAQITVERKKLGRGYCVSANLHRLIFTILHVGFERRVIGQAIYSQVP